VTLFEVDAPAVHLEPVEIVVTRRCHFKAKPVENGVKRRGCLRCNGHKSDPAHLGAPPSFNAFGRSGDGFVYAGLKQQWSRVLLPLLEASGLPKGLRRVVVEGEVSFPDRAKRDQGNYRVLLEKVLGDVLVDGGWLDDDDWDRYEFGNLQRRDEGRVSRTRLMLFPQA
jgi:hypothetical protein